MRGRLVALVRAGGLAPLLLLAGEASAMPAEKAPRADEAGRPAARIAPTPGDLAPADPVAAAFALFPETRAEHRDEAASRDATSVDTLPTPPAVTEVEPGVVAVARTALAPTVPTPAPPPEPAPPAFVLGFAPPSEPRPIPAERLFTAPVPAPNPIAAAASRVLAVPLPRRRPAGLGETEETPLRLANLTPEVPVVPKAAPAPIGTEVAVFGEPKRIPKEALPYLDLMRREAAANKVPLWLAIGVGWVESKYDPKLRGRNGVVGLMQVMPSTARFQGYKGPTEKLLEAETNIVWGMRELGWDWAKAGGDPCMAIAKYKGGMATTKVSPAAADYCRRAKIVTGMM